jgi:tetratricopeptide (TPR) repeat protein
MRDALYDTLLSTQRTEMHLKVGNAVEQRAGSRLSEVVETLAYHFLLSGRADKAFHYCSLSGTKSLEIYSLEEAEGYFRKALNLLKQTPNCAEDAAMATVVVGLLEVLYLKGDLIGLSEIAEAYIPRLEVLGGTPQLVFALYFHCMLLNHFCEFRAAEARAKSAVSIASTLNDVRAQAYARSALLFCSIILGRHSLEEAEREGKRVLEVCTQSGDNYILNWAYWSIAWDYVCRGLTTKARNWTVQLMEAGRQRQDNRALGMAFWTLAWIDIQAYRFSDGIANAERCQRTAATPYDRTAGTMARATGLLLDGPVEEGLAQLLSIKKWALAHRWVYAASGVDFAVGPALAMTGRIGEGIRMLKTAISTSDTTGSLAIASWNRLALAELYLGILSASNQRAPVRIILLNLLPILKVRLFGARDARLLLEQVSSNHQIHPESMTQARIELNLARVYLRQNNRDVAHQHLAKARAAAISQESALMLKEIDAVIAFADGF